MRNNAILRNNPNKMMLESKLLERIEDNIIKTRARLVDLEKNIAKTCPNVEKLREDFLKDFNEKFPAREKNAQDTYDDLQELSKYLAKYSELHFENINEEFLQQWVPNLIDLRDLKQEKIDVRDGLRLLIRNRNLGHGDKILAKDTLTVKQVLKQHKLEEEKQTQQAISVFNTGLYSNKKSTYNEQQQKTITSAIYKTCNNGKHKSFKKINETIKAFIKKDVDQWSICAKLSLLCQQAGIKNLEELKAVGEILFSDKHQIECAVSMLQASEKELNDFLYQKGEHESDTSYVFSITNPLNVENKCNIEKNLGIDDLQFDEEINQNQSEHFAGENRLLDDIFPQESD